MRVLVTLQQVIREGFPKYARSRCLPLHVHTAMRAIADCGTAAMGGHVWVCPDGHEVRVAYNSCRHRACPRCAWSRTESWLAERLAQLLPCDAYHVIFTVPHELEPLWFADRRSLVAVLFESVRRTLLELLADPKYLGARAGVIATLHTWSRTLGFHPHAHCLVTGGGYDGSQWKAVRNGYLLPFRVVRKLFRGKFVAAVRRLLATGKLLLPAGWSRDRAENVLRLVGQKKWNVHVCERYAHGRGVVRYLGRYVRGGPLRNHQLVSAANEVVVFRYMDHRAGEKKLLALEQSQFVQRLTWHVPEPGQHVVRYWGLYAHDQVPWLEAARCALGGEGAAAERLPAASTGSKPPAGESTGAPNEPVCKTCGKALVETRWGRGREPPRGVHA